MRYSALFLLLCACSPQIVEKPVRVEIPVPVSCEIDLPPPPHWKLQSLPKDADHEKVARAMIDDLIVAKAYIKVQDAALQACKE